MLATLAASYLRPDPASVSSGTPGTPAPWLAQIMPGLAAPAPHHARLWAHIWGVQLGVRPAPYVLIVARGGGKSTTAELAAVALFARAARRYCWYISRTQDQADQHVESISEILESEEVGRHHPLLGERLLSKYGYAEGWRVNRLRAADGSTVDAIGLDKATRGRRVGRQRPDLMIIDDIDLDTDGQDQTDAVLDTLRLKVLPAGTPDLAVLFVQNLILADGVAARLAEGRAGILTDAVVDGPHPALRPRPGILDRAGQPTVVLPDGAVDGIPTWEGQDVTACNAYVRTYGLPAFLEECQHEVARGGRRFPNWDDGLHVGDPPSLDNFTSLWCALDYGFDHPLAFGVLGRTVTGERWLLAEYGARETLVPQHCRAFEELLDELGIEPAQLRARVAGRDLWARRDTDKAQPETLADRFAREGWHFAPAEVDRVNGWQAVAELLGDPDQGQPVRLRIARRCARTIAQVKALRRDPRRPNDALKVNANRRGEGGDDYADMLRYGVMVAPPMAAITRAAASKPNVWSEL